MVIEYGMSDKIGPLSFGRDGFRGGDGRILFPGEGPQMSEATANVVDEEVSRMVNEAHDRAREILEQRRDLLERLSRVLMSREVIEGKDLNAYVDGTKPIPTPEELAHEEAPTEQLSGPTIVATPSE
jgi:cell division protease FtsH